MKTKGIWSRGYLGFSLAARKRRIALWGLRVFSRQTSAGASAAAREAPAAAVPAQRDLPAARQSSDVDVMSLSPPKKGENT